MFRLSMLTLLITLLCACATTSPKQMKTNSFLQQGKLDFDGGYYQRALHELLPIACDGNAEAQYAVGYMYYYGYGVAQDQYVGGFWIKRSAGQGYPPAIDAAKMLRVE